MTNERALEIIAGHGACEARWPDAERAAVLALAGSDAVVAAALVAAQRLDAVLNSWVHDVPQRSFDAAAIIAAAAAVAPVAAVPPVLQPSVAAPRRRPARPAMAMRRWLAGGAVAVAAVLGVAVLGPGARMPVAAPVAVAAMSATVAAATPVAVPPVVLAAVDSPAGIAISTNTGLAGDAATRLAVAEGDAMGSDAEVFAHVFTPTVYEDELI